MSPQITYTKLTKMKKFFCLFLALAFITSAKSQTVGIGTTVPDSNAVLDVFSDNKGILIPRVGDTGTIASPLEGMIIYNKNTKTPYYHDGIRWVSLGGRLPSGATSAQSRITYQVSAPGFSGTELDATSFQWGAGIGVGPGGPSLSSSSEITFTKQFDIDSDGFNLATLRGTNYPSIEFKFYAGASLAPYLSYRLQNIYFSGYSVSTASDIPSEAISIYFENYGFWDRVNNVQFGFNVRTHTNTAY